MFLLFLIHLDWFCFQFCVGCLSRRDQILEIDGLGQKLLLEVTVINSIPRCYSVHYYRKTLKVWIVWKIKSSILKVKLNWFLRQNNKPDVPISFRQEFSKKSRNHFNLMIFFGENFPNSNFSQICDFQLKLVGSLCKNHNDKNFPPRQQKIGWRSVTWMMTLTVITIFEAWGSGCNQCWTH